MAFGVNTFLFLLVGLSSNPATLIASAPQTAIAVACVFAGRAAAIYLPFLILGWARPSQAVPPRWQHVFVLGNIKGALSIALALALPKATPFRPLLVDVAFGVTFISLVAQGLLLGRVLERLGLTRGTRWPRRSPSSRRSWSLRVRHGPSWTPCTRTGWCRGWPTSVSGASTRSPSLRPSGRSARSRIGTSRRALGSCSRSAAG